jgi:hypothetical protein
MYSVRVFIGNRVGGCVLLSIVMPPVNCYNSKIFPLRGHYNDVKRNMIKCTMDPTPRRGLQMGLNDGGTRQVLNIGDNNIMFLWCTKVHVDLYHACLCGWHKFLLEWVLDLFERHITDDILKDFLGHQRENATQQLLILIIPMSIHRIGDFSDAHDHWCNDPLLRCGIEFIKVSHKLQAP